MNPEKESNVMKQEKVTSLTQEQEQGPLDSLPDTSVSADGVSPTEDAGCAKKDLVALRLKDKYTLAKPCCVADTPEAHTVWIKIGGQSFSISGYQDTLAEANWMRHMLGKAFQTMLELEAFEYRRLTLLQLPDKTDRSSHTEAQNAFVKLHQDWLGASHRNDMNEAMDALATALQLDPLTLRPINDKKQFESSEPEPVKHEKELGK